MKADDMIALTRLNGSRFYLNAVLVQVVEGTPDTVITLSNNTKVVVKEPPEVVIEMIVAFLQRVHNPQVAPQSGE